MRYASASRKPTCSERVTRLDSGLNAAITSWYVENASATPATSFHAAPVQLALDAGFVERDFGGLCRDALAPQGGRLAHRRGRSRAPTYLITPTSL